MMSSKGANYGSDRVWKTKSHSVILWRLKEKLASGRGCGLFKAGGAQTLWIRGYGALCGAWARGGAFSSDLH